MEFEKKIEKIIFQEILGSTDLDKTIKKVRAYIPEEKLRKALEKRLSNQGKTHLRNLQRGKDFDPDKIIYSLHAGEINDYELKEIVIPILRDNGIDFHHYLDKFYQDPIERLMALR